MNVRRGGLGRGLGALIPTAPVDGEPGVAARFEEVPIDLVDPNPRQPREVFDEEAMAELVTSIREVGVLQPIVVREVDGGRYQLIMGERRLRASRLAGMDHVPAIVRDTADDDLLRDALLENLHRQQLNPLEEAAAYQQLLNEFGATHEELADRIGRSRSHVSNTLRLMNLPPVVQRRVAAGVLSAGHARALLALDDPERMETLAGRIVAEGLSVRAVEEIVTAPEPTAGRRTRIPVQQPESVAEVERRLAERLDTRIRVELGRRRGKVTIEFADEADLQRLASLIVDGHEPAAEGHAADTPGDPPADAHPEEEHHPEEHHPEEHHWQDSGQEWHG
jgi:ParB family chromosome partitioning protein